MIGLKSQIQIGMAVTNSIKEKTTKVEFGVTGSGSYGSAQPDDCELRTAGMIYPCTLNIEQSETAMPDVIESREQLSTEAQPLELFTLPITQQPPPSEPKNNFENTAISSAVIRGNGTTQSKTPEQLDYAAPANFDSKIIAGYLSEWSVYGREFDVEFNQNQNGNFPYNKLVVAFLGICGDNGKLKGTIDEQCRKQNLTDGEAVFLDPWALFWHQK